MNRTVILISAAVIAIAIGTTGYWIGQRSSASSMRAPTSSSGADPRVLYYRNPMGLPDTSQVPKKDSMGMDYIPVYAGGETEAPGTIKVDIAKVQRSGIRTDVAVRMKIAHEVHAVGAIKVDEGRFAVVMPRVEGWIERVYVGATGLAVTAGEPLVEIYSPELVQTQEEYLLAHQAMKGGVDPSDDSVGSGLADAALERLQNLGISSDQIRQIAASGHARRTLTLTALISGVVMEKNAVLGQRFMPGEQLYRIADISRLWVVTKVPEQDLPSIQLGGRVSIVVNTLPGKPINGVVGFIASDIDRETRTADIRIEVPNSDRLLRPDMYASVTFLGGDKTAETVAIPDSAIIDSGTRQVVLVAKENGQFEPRQVSVGSRANGYTAILNGISEGEKVVVNATFLIDAESNLKAALQTFTDAPASSQERVQ